MNVKQLQQFLGLENYMKDFIPHITQHQSTLAELITKNPPPWSIFHSKVIKKLKELSKNLPAFQIPSEQGKKIFK